MDIIENVGRELRDGGEPFGVLIVSDVRLVSESLVETLGRHRALSISGTCAELDQALSLIPELKPHIVLLDAAMPGGAGVVCQLQEADCAPRVIAVNVSETDESIVAWAEAGIAGYVSKATGLADIAPIVVDIMRGEQACSGRAAATLLRRLANVRRSHIGGQDAPPAPALTAREQEIMLLIAAGSTNKEIARRLGIGVTTTKSHVHNLLTKLKLQNRGQVARWMRDQGRHPRMLSWPSPQRLVASDGADTRLLDGIDARAPVTARGSEDTQPR